MSGTVIGERYHKQRRRLRPFVPWKGIISRVSLEEAGRGEIVGRKIFLVARKKKLEKPVLDGEPADVIVRSYVGFSVCERSLDKSCRLAEAFSPLGSEEKNFCSVGRGVTVVKVIAGRRIMARLGRCTAGR